MICSACRRVVQWSVERGVIAVFEKALMQIQQNPAIEDIQFLENQIYEHNVTRTGHTDGILFGIFLRDDDGQIIAGLHGWTWAGWLEVSVLWVQADRRGAGLGK